jgi:lariat debranching enzyme
LLLYPCDSCCRYYSGEKVAPVLTIFIGGNHEASNYLQELAYGGWVAPRIYYMGYASIVNIAGVRVGGLSGIYKGHDYFKGHFEKSPYTEDTKRSVYHVRNLETFRLKQVICNLK